VTDDTAPPSGPTSDLSLAPEPEASAPSAAAADAPAIPRFRPLELPSAPFWVALFGVIVGTLLLVATSSALLVFGIGTALAFFLVPLVNWLVRKGWPRIGASIAVVAALVVLTLAGLAVGAFILIEQGKAFLEALPAYLEQIGEDIEALDLPSWLQQTIDTIATSVHDLIDQTDVSTFVIGLAQGLMGMVGVLFSFMLLPFFLFYLLKDQPRMAANFYRNVPLPWKADVGRILTMVTTDVAQYFKAELLVGAIMFLIVSIGMFVIGSVMPDAGILVSFALLLGLLAFVFELIPQIGPILSYIPALILSLTVGPETVIVVSAFYFVAFNIEGSILVPTFEGKMISFSGATVLVLITMGFALGGIIGAIVALPVAAIARDVYSLFFRRAQEQAGVPPTSAAEEATEELAGELTSEASVQATGSAAS
jgi:predicted PurR-regulated permease PerM